MKTIVIFVACSSLILLGCSKSNKSQTTANNGSSASASNAGGGSAGPTDLKIKWQIGKRYDMNMDLNQTSDIKMAGQPFHQVLKLTQAFNFSPLKELDNGGHVVQLQFDSQSLILTQNGKQIVSYDSTQKTPVEPNNPAAPVAAAMGAMLGVSLDYTFAADGTVQNIDGIDTLKSRITAAVPNQRQRMSLQQLYDESTLKQYADFAQGLPGHPVNVGDSWSSSRDFTSPIGVATINFTFTFKDWEQRDGHNCAHLLLTGDIKTKSTSATTMGAVVKIDKGSVNGDAWFDPDLGMLVESVSDTDMTLNITTRDRALTEQMNRNVDLSLVGVN